MLVELYNIGTKSCTGLEIDTRILAQFQGVYSWISTTRRNNCLRSHCLTTGQGGWVPVRLTFDYNEPSRSFEICSHFIYSLPASGTDTSSGLTYTCTE
jgi:hypothetical protein